MMPALLPVLPLIIIATTITVGVVAISIRRNQVFIFCLTLAGIIAAFATLPVLGRVGPRASGVLFLADSFALYYSAIALAGTFAIAVLSYDYLKRRMAFEAGESNTLSIIGRDYQVMHDILPKGYPAVISPGLGYILVPSGGKPNSPF